MYLTKVKCDKITTFDQIQPFGTYNVTMGFVDHVQFSFKHYNNSFKITVNAF